MESLCIRRDLALALPHCIHVSMVRTLYAVRCAEGCYSRQIGSTRTAKPTDDGSQASSRAADGDCLRCRNKPTNGRAAATAAAAAQEGSTCSGRRPPLTSAAMSSQMAAVGAGKWALGTCRMRDMLLMTCCRRVFAFDNRGAREQKLAAKPCRLFAPTW